MQVIQVPKDSPNVTLGYSLDGADYFLRFEWNMRAGWFMGMDDSEREVIFSPRALVIGVDMLSSVRYDSRTPPGVLVAIDLTDSLDKPRYKDLVSGSSMQDLQGKVIVLYMSQEEFADV